MSKHNIFLEITNGIWLIEKSYADSQFLLIDSILKGNFNVLDKENVVAKYFSIDNVGAVSFSSKDTKPFSNSSSRSTAVIYVSGPIMKHDNCGAPGTQTYISLVQSAAANPNIGSILMVDDTPGGTVNGTEGLHEAVLAAKTQKPVLTLVDGLLASAGYWFASASTEIYASNKTDRIGSIGTMVSFADLQAMYEKQGVVFHEIYADASTQKNQEFIQARQGKYDALKATLNSINDVFVGAVKSNRGDRLNQKETLSGKMFMAQDAISVGLIDGFKTFDEAIARAQELANSQEFNQSSNTNQNQSNMKSKLSWAAITAFFSGKDSTFKADETVLTEDHLSQMNAELATLAQAKTDLTAAIARAEKAEGELATANTSIQTLTTAKTSADTELADLKAKHPGATAPIKKVTDTTTAEEKESDFSCDVDDEVRASREKLYGPRK